MGPQDFREVLEASGLGSTQTPKFAPAHIMELKHGQVFLQRDAQSVRLALQRAQEESPEEADEMLELVAAIDSVKWLAFSVRWTNETLNVPHLTLREWLAEQGFPWEA